MSIYKGLIPAIIILSICRISAAETTELHWNGCEISRTAYVNDLATAYSHETGIQIKLHDGNSSSGIRAVHNGTVDIGGTSRYLLTDDPRENGVELLPVAWDALAIIVHKDNPIVDISLSQLKAIYTGKVRNWAKLGGKNHKLELFMLKSKHSGTGRSVRELLFANPNKYIPASRTFEYVSELEQALSRNPHAIALTGISNARRGDFKIITLDGVEPSTANIKSGTYSLYRPLYLAYNPTSAKAESVKGFMSFVTSKTGRDVMYKNGVVPYRDAMSLVMKMVRDNEASYQQLVGKN